MTDKATTGSDAVDLDKLERFDMVPGECGRMSIGPEDDGEFVRYSDVAALIAQARAAAPTAFAGWEYCPECGCMETDPPQEGMGYFCANCGQEWHGDIDYSEVVRKNLARAAVPAAIPEGWAVVPKNPHVAQVRAGLEADANAHHVTDIYAAMIAAAPTAPKNLHDALRQSGADRDYHGRIAFLPAQFERFVALFGAPTATAEPVATIDTPEFQELLAEWNNADVDAADAYSCEQYRRIVEHISTKIAAPAPQQAAPLTVEQIVEIAEANEFMNHDTGEKEFDRLGFARAIESKVLSAGSAASAGDATIEQDAARWRYIEEHATTHGGGNGFTITCFVPVDEEDMGCAIDAAMAATKEKKQ